MNTICITNRKIAEENGLDFLEQIERVAKKRPFKIILREKDLSETDYKKLAGKCFEICRKYNIEFAVNKFIAVAKDIGIKNIHLSATDFFENVNDLSFFECTGVSIHSKEEAKRAEKSGADYLIAGHIFKTDCKKDIPPRGVGFLKEICNSVKIPVFAIGGITSENACDCIKNNASGVCLMSSFMKSENIHML